MRMKNRPREGHTRPPSPSPYKAHLARVHRVPPRTPATLVKKSKRRAPTVMPTPSNPAPDRHWVTGFGWKPGPAHSAESRADRAARPWVPKRAPAPTPSLLTGRATARQEAAAAKTSAYEKIRADEITRTTKKPRPAQTARRAPVGHKPVARKRPPPAVPAPPRHPRSKFAVGSVVAEIEKPHSALEVVAAAGEFYTLSYRDAGAWRGHEITWLGYQLVAFGAELPRRSKQAENYCED